MILELFSFLLGRLSSQFTSTVHQQMRTVDINDPDEIEKAAPAITAVVREFREKAAALANQLMADEAKKVGGAALVPPVEFYPEQAVKKTMRDSPSLIVAIQALERHVRTAARRQVVRSVPGPEHVPAYSGITPESSEVEETDAGLTPTGKTEFRLQPTSASDRMSNRPAVYPRAWARVLTGRDNCPFCIMLASRGPIYSSASHALKRSKVRTSWESSEASWANSYHDNCDCMAVPVYDLNNYQGKAQADYLYKVYEKVTRDYIAAGRKISEGNNKLKAFSDFLADESTSQLEIPALEEDWIPPSEADADRRLQRIMDNKPRPLANSNGNSARHLKSSIPESEELYDHELEFLHRFEAKGYTAEWIPKAVNTPTNDFYWVEKDYTATELKAAKNRYSTISTRIKDAVSKARNHSDPVVKENFIIDLGNIKMDDKLRHQLGTYNLRNPKNTITTLWVMHSDGEKFEEIHLVDD